MGDTGYAGRAFAQAVDALDATIVRPSRRDEPGRQLAPIRQRIELIFFTRKGLLTLERHGARTLAHLWLSGSPYAFSAWRPASGLKHWLGRPRRSLVAHVA